MGSYPPHSDLPARSPEILPPNHVGGPAPRFSPDGTETVESAELRAVRERVAPRGAARAEGRSWAYAPATYILVGINCAVFVLMVLSRVSFMAPTSLQLFYWGATEPAAVLLDGQWWRVVTAMFVHVGIVHLATNMWCLWNLGLLGEPLVGPLGVFAAYILSGAAGNLLSIAVMAYTNHGAVGAGASGAVFGIAGVLIVLLKSPRLPIPPAELKGLRNYVIYFAVINFVIGFGATGISEHFTLGMNVDNMAHLGGLIGGVIFALPMIPKLGSPKGLFLMRRRLAVGVLTSVLVLFAYYLSVWAGAQG
jgi:rhomboid protease GluP